VGAEYEAHVSGSGRRGKLLSCVMGSRGGGGRHRGEPGRAAAVGEEGVGVAGAWIGEGERRSAGERERVIYLHAIKKDGSYAHATKKFRDTCMP
jgi:hypothetical protein